MPFWRPCLCHSYASGYCSSSPIGTVPSPLTVLVPRGASGLMGSTPADMRQLPDIPCPAPMLWPYVAQFPRRLSRLGQVECNQVVK